MFGYLVCAVFFAILTRQTWIDAVVSRRKRTVMMAAVYVPIWPAKFILPVGFAAITLVTIAISSLVHGAAVQLCPVSRTKPMCETRTLEQHSNRLHRGSAAVWSAGLADPDQRGAWLVSFIGIGIIVSWKAAWGIITAIPFNFVGDWNLTAIPMFLLMGFVASGGGPDHQAFPLDADPAVLAAGRACSQRGRNAVLAAASGSSVAICFRLCAHRHARDAALWLSPRPCHRRKSSRRRARWAR